MAYRRGDVIAVPYDYSDLTGGKVRPAVIISSDAYNLAQPDLVLAGISTQVHRATDHDYLLVDWTAANLRYPSLVRGRFLTLEQNLVRRTVGRLTPSDVAGVENKLINLLLSDRAVVTHAVKADLTMLPGQLVQALATESIGAALTLAKRANRHIDLNQLRTLFPT